MVVFSRVMYWKLVTFLLLLNECSLFTYLNTVHSLCYIEKQRPVNPLQCLIPLSKTML